MVQFDRLLQRIGQQFRSRRFQRFTFNPDQPFFIHPKVTTNMSTLVTNADPNRATLLDKASGPQQVEVLQQRDGTLRCLVLNRPAALNALTLDMIRLMTSQLMIWEQSPMTKCIVVKSQPPATGRPASFCAGGDVVALKKAVEEETNAEVAELPSLFFREEYRLNHYISTLKTPFVALMDGITMGGGVGISVHGAFRVATERTVFAMPETAIGFVTDVGATYFLSRMEASLGVYLALTGNRLTGADVYWAGMATHYVPSDRLPALLQRLASLETTGVASSVDGVGPVRSSQSHEEALLAVNACLDLFTGKVGPFSLDPYCSLIEDCFSGQSLLEIITLLRRYEKESVSEKERQFAASLLQTLQQASPVALEVTLHALHQGKQFSLAQCLEMEKNLVRLSLLHGDFCVGVQSKLIEKQKQRPHWQSFCVWEEPLNFEKYKKEREALLQRYFSNKAEKDNKKVEKEWNLGRKGLLEPWPKIDFEESNAVRSLHFGLPRAVDIRDILCRPRSNEIEFPFPESALKDVRLDVDSSSINEETLNVLVSRVVKKYRTCQGLKEHAEVLIGRRVKVDENGVLRFLI